MQTCVRIRRSVLAFLRQLPAGAVFAGLFIALVHTCFSSILFPHPVARADLRRKVMAVTENRRPALVFAGDSRADCNINPNIIASAMGLSHADVVNIGVKAGDSAMILAVYREFGDRFAPRPIFVVSVSPHFVSDRGELHDQYNFEYYWSVGLMARLSALSVRNAIRATFAPERHLINAMGDYFTPPEPDPPFLDTGFRPLDEPPVELPGSGYAKTILRLAKWRCFTVGQASSTPWQRLRADLGQLRKLGVSVVVLDTPDHPEFLARLSGTPEGDNYTQYRTTLAHLCERLSIPLLRYSVADLGSVDPDGLFWDGVHLNAEGAALLSKRVAVDLDRLISRGLVPIHRPSSDSS